jgi:glycosyltransferase involved in cell wall biosynthesis
MKFSIVTAVRNAKDTLPLTIASVRKQTFRDVEYIVIDGASSDGTIDVIQANATSITKWISEPDSGIYDAMNKGIRLATGDVISFLNADDVYVSDLLLEEIAELMSCQDLDAVYADVVYVRASSPDKIRRRYRSGRFSPALLGWGIMPAHPSLFLRRQIFDKVGEFRADYRISGDFEFIARVFSDPALKFQYVPKVFVRMNLGGISTSGWRSNMLGAREVLRACRENSIATNWLMIMSKYPFKLLEFIRLK